ncbi:hypothetical protein LT679_07200 [Mucilaginibacter roseus]|uniref:DUF5117 domain-containing protein n=1 Tax=Mucilaginibacter roseus TaxID=1528868 RepID=A0ABS8U3C8_9SPHI|nr:hypothetical protein [Mucilaginibacter roseus]MCD8740384.1 hypothetical protein [Mucilaginibacter roseus]
MNRLIWTLILSLNISLCFAQQDDTEKLTEEQRTYIGPLRYRTLKETIGETYVVLPLDIDDMKSGYAFLANVTTGEKRAIASTAGKHLKLLSIDDDFKYGNFVDSVGMQYQAKTSLLKLFYQVAPAKDIEDARQLLLNKKLWINFLFLKTGNPYDWRGALIGIENVRFEPVTVINVSPSTTNGAPVLLTLKTDKGIIGYSFVDVSGTNTDHDPVAYFKNNFFTKDPQTIYKYPAAVWKNIKAGKVTLGMTEEQVTLIKGEPERVNVVKTGGKVYRDMIYMEPKYQSYLLLNGKVTLIK